MHEDESEELDEVASDLDELTETVEELQENPPAGAHTETMQTLAEAVEQAPDAADTLEDEPENS